MKDNLNNLDEQYSNYSSVIVNDGKKWLDYVSSPIWIMREWFMSQVKKAEEMYRRAITEKSGSIV